MDKDKKKTLTISSDLKKKIDTSSISTSGKKSFSVEKKSLSGQINPSINLPHHLILILILMLRKKILQENLSNNKQLKNLLKRIINQQEKVS